MTFDDYAAAVACAAQSLASGELDWDDHYRLMGHLWVNYSLEHGEAGWGAVVTAASRVAS